MGFFTLGKLFPDHPEKTQGEVSVTSSFEGLSKWQELIPYPRMQGHLLNETEMANWEFPFHV